MTLTRSLRLLAVFLILACALGALVGSASARQPQPPLDKPLPGLDALPAYLSPPTIQKPGDSLAQAAPSGSRWAYLAYESFRDDNWEIYLGDRNGNFGVRLTEHGAVDQTPRINPTATQVAFVSNRDGANQLFIMNIDGSGVRKLTGAGGRQEILPAWSPDGQQIAFSARADDNSRWNLYTIRPDGSGETQLVPNSVLNNLYPSWSPDGSQLAWVVADGSGMGQIWVMNAGGSQPHPLAAPMRYLTSPVWSPDGQRLAFDADFDGDSWNELGLIGADGQGLQMLYDPGKDFVDAYMGCWYLNGEEILFSRLEYLSYQNELYLTATYVDRYFVRMKYSQHLISDGLSMSPDYISTDRLPPVLELYDLPPYSRAKAFSIYWKQSDAGGSGLYGTHIQIKEGPAGEWQDLIGLGSYGYNYGSHYSHTTGKPGQELYFRARAHDSAYNWGEWSPTIPHTKLYAYELTGSTRDTREIALPGVDLQIDPAPLNPVNTGPGAAYRAYLVNPGSYSIQASLPGYTHLPASGVVVEGDQVYDTWMLPDDNLIVDGGFEAGPEASVGWTRGLTVTVEATPRETGQYNAQFGHSCWFQPCLSAPEFVPLPAADEFRLVTDDQGNQHVFLTVDATSGIYYLKRVGGEGWSQPVLIPGSENGDFGYGPIDLPIDAHGNLYFVWMSEVNYQQQIYFSERLTENGAWTDAQFLGEGFTNPVVVVDSRGGVHVGSEGPGIGYSYWERLPSGEWQPPVKLASTAPWGKILAVGPDDSLHFAWFDRDSNHVKYRIRPAGGTWKESETLPLTESKVALALDRQNSVHILSGQELISRPAGGAWSDKQTVLPTTSYDWAFMAADSHGTLYLMYVNNWDTFVGKRRAGAWSDWVELPEALGSRGLDLIVDNLDHLHIIAGTVHSNGWGFHHYTDQAPLEDILHSISQSVQIPAGMHRPTLSFWYSLSEGSENAASGLSVQVASEASTAEVFSTREQTGWKHAWADLSPWTGQTVTIVFTLQQKGGEFFRAARLDDVTLGSWLTPVLREAAPPTMANDWAGQVLTLSGENFLEGVTVQIGSTPALSVERVDEFTLRVTLPPGLERGYYDLWVTNPDGQATALADGLRLGQYLFLPFAGIW